MSMLAMAYNHEAAQTFQDASMHTRSESDDLDALLINVWDAASNSGWNATTQTQDLTRQYSHDLPSKEWVDTSSSHSTLVDYSHYYPQSVWQPHQPMPPPESITKTPLSIYEEQQQGISYFPNHPNTSTTSLPSRGGARAPLIYGGHDDYCDTENPHETGIYNRRLEMMGAPPRARIRLPRQPLFSAVAGRARSPRMSQAIAGGSSSQPGREDRLFVCASCPAQFARKRDRDRHVRSIHTLEERYKCYGCNAGFVRSDARGRHWKADPQCHDDHMAATTQTGQDAGFTP